MLKWCYLITVILSLIINVYYYNLLKNNTHKNYFLLLISSFISNYGYAMQVFSQTLEGVLCGNQIYYIASIATCIFMLIIISDLCGLPINKYIKTGIFVYSLVIMFLVSTVSFLPYYYKTIEFATYLGCSYIQRTYGPLHILFVLFVVGINLSNITIIIVAIIKGKKISLKISLELASLIFIGTLFYIIPRLLHIPLEFMPFGYLVMEVYILFLLKQLSLYDMTATLINVYEQRQEFGYITFDMHKRFMGCNEFAFTIFPELKDNPFNAHIKPGDNPLSNKLVPYLENWKNNNEEPLSLEINDLVISCKVKYITYNSKNIGYFIELEDKTEANKYLQFLSKYNQQLESNVEEKAERILQIQDSIITGMASMVESRDNSTGGHIKRTSQGVKIILDQLKKENHYEWLTDDFYNKMIKAAPMHDLGKIAVDDSILRKPGKFTPEEYEAMKQHPTEGARIVLGVLREVEDEEFKIIAMNVAHYHHEKWDGTGYPTGKKGEEIPIEARIMAFADVFDALVTKRCYKDAFSYDQAFEIIEKDLGTHFDPILGKEFLKCRQELEAMYTLDELINSATNMQ